MGQILLALATGLALGWLTGVSDSSFVATLLQAALGALAGGVTVLTVLRHELARIARMADLVAARAAEAGIRDGVPLADPGAVSLRLIAALIIGTAAGATIGSYAQKNYWLDPAPIAIVNRWSPTGLSPKDIAARIFDKEYRSSSRDRAGSTSTGMATGRPAGGDTSNIPPSGVKR